MPAMRKARALRPGDTIGIATPASPIEPHLLEAGAALIRDLGFEPRLGSAAAARRGYLAGSDESRARELTELVEDQAVHAIWCARGGYGCQRVVSRLDPQAFRKAAKPLIGYSDITTLLLWQARSAGLIGLHGPMLERGNTVASDSHRALARALTGVGELPRLSGRPLEGSVGPGWGEGRLTGGSLTLVAASLGTPWEIDTRNSILLLEEVHEAPYRIDRMLWQLHAAGKLEVAAGIGIGSTKGCDVEDPTSPSVEAVLKEILAPLDVPTVVDLPFGHADPNCCWPYGGRAAIDAQRGEIELLEFAVARR